MKTTESTTTIKTVLCLALGLILLKTPSMAQMKLGAAGSPVSSAMLELMSNNRGFLPTRLDLFTLTGGNLSIYGLNGPDPAQEGMIVYNTANTAPFTAGLYVWKNNTWKQINTAATDTTAWHLTGNAGTIDGTNFIGTTDNVPFNIRVNNQKAGRIEIDPNTANTFYGYQSGKANTSGYWNNANGYQALYSNTSGVGNLANGYQALYQNTEGGGNTANGVQALYSNTSGLYNTANGLYTLYSNTIGYNNTANGGAALQANTTGNDNTANGFQALQVNTIGNNNTANGSVTLYSNTSGSNNTANGYFALPYNTTGNNNTANGNGALYNNTNGSKNTALGYNTGLGITTGNANTILGANVIGLPAALSNTVILADGDGNQRLYINNLGNAGIGTTTPGAKLEVAGQVKITGGNPGNKKVLISDATGLASWQALGATDTTAWHLTGNAGTDPVINFMGTTDDKDVVFKRNNVRAGLLSKGNTSFGERALSNNNPGLFNTAIGNAALESNFGSFNTAIGVKALYSNITGNDNTAIGNAALGLNTDGIANTATGEAALDDNTTGSDNTANGLGALQANTGGNWNTAVGSGAFPTSTTGNKNTALGVGTGSGIITGNANTILGANVTGLPAALSNTVILADGDGNQRLYINNLGNAGIGTTTPGAKLEVAGQVKITGGNPGANKVLTSDVDGLATWQTLAPPSATAWSLTGNAGTDPTINFMGTTDDKDIVFKRNNVQAALLNSAGFNTSFGVNALNAGSTGSANTAIGTNAGQSNTLGKSNSFVGYRAGNLNKEGNANTFIGSDAGFTNNLGSFNAFVGNLAGYSNTWGDQNAFFGYGAGYNNKTGNKNTYLGYGSGSLDPGSTSATTVGALANVIAGVTTNATAVGANAIVNANNKVRLGNATVTKVEGPVVYTVSDGRFKNNISESDVKGLEFIKRLRPVVYNFDTRKFEEFLTNNMPDTLRKKYLETDFAPSTAIRQSGFIAQEVEKAAKEVGYNFNGVYSPETEGDNYSLAYGQFVVPLVKGMQEQQKMIDKQQQEIESQRKEISLKDDRIATLEAKMNSIDEKLAQFDRSLEQCCFNSQQSKAQRESTPAISTNIATANEASLEQNVPNPFNENSAIACYLPETVKEAVIKVFSSEGVEIKSYGVKEKGYNKIIISANSLAPGIYVYSLITDGNAVASKTMVITK